MNKLRIVASCRLGVFALSLLFSLNASATILARQCGAIGIVTYDPMPHTARTQIFVGGESVNFVYSADGRTLAAMVPMGTLVSEVTVKVGDIDVSSGFARSVEGTVFYATLLAPYDVPKKDGVSNEPWTELDDGTVVLNVMIVPGLYYAAASAACIGELKCPGTMTPATSEMVLIVSKPRSDTQGFYKVWVSDKAIEAE